MDRLNFRSINDMDLLIRRRLSIIPDDIELIVGIPRSGMLPAAMLALYLNLPLTDIKSLLSENDHDTVSRHDRIKGNKNSTNIRDYNKILILDDSCHTGASINEVKQEIAAIHDCETEVLYSCVYVTPQAIENVDLYFEIVPQPRVFEWNVMNHPFSYRFCMDMDGVLCVDPSNEQNDDGEKYIDFILNAKPLWIPKYGIGVIVTSRLEKYRSYTEKWLKDNNVNYHNLVMLDLPDKETRARIGAHAPFKADIYSQIDDAWLFVESDPAQAKYIADATGKAVYCVTDNNYYDVDMSMENYISLGNSLDNYASQISGVLMKLVDLYEHMDDDSLRPSLIRALLTGWKTIISDMTRIYSASSCAALSEMNDMAYAYGQKNDYDNCCSILASMPELCCKIINSESRRQMLAAAERVTNAAWNREWRFVCEYLTKNLLSGDIADEEYKDEIQYLREINHLQMYPYKWTEEYKEDKVVVYTHDCGMKYVMHGDRPLFWRRSSSDDAIRREYSQLLMEQDIRSPHRYLDELCDFREGDILIDVGAAEGIISLDVIDKASRVVLIECDDEWVNALKYTFKDYMDKVTIVEKYAGAEDTDTIVTLDTLMKDCKDERIFIKLDIEGMEMDALAGAESLIRNNHSNISCAVYHMQLQEREISGFLDALGYNSYPSEGYVLFLSGYMVMKNGKYKRIEPPYFRRALVKAVPSFDVFS